MRPPHLGGRDRLRSTPVGRGRTFGGVMWRSCLGVPRLKCLLRRHSSPFLRSATRLSARTAVSWRSTIESIESIATATQKCRSPRVVLRRKARRARSVKYRSRPSACSAPICSSFCQSLSHFADQNVEVSSSLLSQLWRELGGVKCSLGRL